MRRIDYEDLRCIGYEDLRRTDYEEMEHTDYFRCDLMYLDSGEEWTVVKNAVWQ